MGKKDKKSGKSESTSDDSQELPPQQAQLFKTVVKLYETKKHKQCIKSADTILKTHPHHGETLAMKGLCLKDFHKEKEERVKAAQMVREGLSYNLRSQLCWHVYGLILKSERKSHEAAKCYINALRISPEDNQVLREIANLQIQNRHLEAFRETRRKILVLQPGHRNNWLAYAIGNHVAGDLKRAVSILNKYEGTMTAEMKKPSIENSEMYLYKLSILYELEDFDTVLSLYKKYKSDNQIKDQQFMQELLGKVMICKDRTKEAEVIYRGLIASNPDNYEYHMGVRHSMGLNPLPAVSESKQSKNPYGAPFLTVPPVLGYSDSQISKLKELYESLQKEFPKVASVFRLPLDFLQGDDFRRAVSTYLMKGLRKGIPSLFRDIRPLYKDTEKLSCVGEVIFGFIDNLRAANRFLPESAKQSELPDSLLWCLFYAASHLDYLKDYRRALEFVEEGITHTPTFTDLYVLKARVFKHSGDHAKAFEAMNYARTLDLADRYLNTKCVRYAFRNNDVDEANKIVGLFLKDADKLISLYDMQVMWYERAAGSCFERKREIGRALKMYHSIREHFDDFMEDQYDFHNYCLKKMTLHSYVRLLRWADKLRGHKYFVAAALGAIRMYLILYDTPEESKSAEEKELEALDPNERKKRLRQINKQKAKEVAEGKAEEHKDAELIRRDGQVDSDPFGEQLKKTERPLEEAISFLKRLQALHAESIDTHLAAFEIYLRKKKFLVCLQSIKRGLRIEAGNSQLRDCIDRFFRAVDNQPNLHETVSQIIATEKPLILSA